MIKNFRVIFFLFLAIYNAKYPENIAVANDEPLRVVICISFSRPITKTSILHPGTIIGILLILEVIFESSDINPFSFCETIQYEFL